MKNIMYNLIYLEIALAYMNHYIYINIYISILSSPTIILELFDPGEMSS